MNELFFLKSFDAACAEKFINKYILPQVGQCIPDSSRFISVAQFLKTDNSYNRDEWEHEHFEFKFGYIKGQEKSISEFSLITLRMAITYPIAEKNIRCVGKCSVEERAEYIRGLSCTHIPIDFVFSNEHLVEFAECIEVSDTNEYSRYEKQFIRDSFSGYDEAEMIQRERLNRIDWDVSDDDDTDHFCEACQESPCRCSDPDPG